MVNSNVVCSMCRSPLLSQRYLSKTRSGHADDGCELHLHSHVPARALAHAILRHAVVRAAVFFLHLVDLQHVAPEIYTTLLDMKFLFFLVQEDNGVFSQILL